MRSGRSPLPAVPRPSATSTSPTSSQRDATAIQEYVKAEASRRGSPLHDRRRLHRLGPAGRGDAARRRLPSERRASVYSNSNPGDFLSCVRNRESGGNYGVYNSGGSGAAGAYQFLPGTWNSIAASSGRSDLVGVDPAQAAPADQDAMAAGALRASRAPLRGAAAADATDLTRAAAAVRGSRRGPAGAETHGRASSRRAGVRTG